MKFSCCFLCLFSISLSTCHILQAKGDRNFLPFHNPSVRLFLLVFVCQITYLLGRESCVTDYLSHGGSLVAQPDNDVLLLLPF